MMYRIVDVDTRQALGPEANVRGLRRLYDAGDRHPGDYRVVDDDGRPVSRRRALELAERRAAILRGMRRWR